jgi:hypothetical protein
LSIAEVRHTHPAISLKTVKARKANGMRETGLVSRSPTVGYAIFHGWMKAN